LQHKDCVPKSGSFSEFLEADPFQYIDEGNRSNGEETKPRWKMEADVVKLYDIWQFPI
jgi:hypothetical protein